MQNLRNTLSPPHKDSNVMVCGQKPNPPFDRHSISSSCRFSFSYFSVCEGGFVPLEKEISPDEKPNWLPLVKAHGQCILNLHFLGITALKIISSLSDLGLRHSPFPLHRCFLLCLCLQTPTPHRYLVYLSLITCHWRF